MVYINQAFLPFQKLLLQKPHLWLQNHLNNTQFLYHLYEAKRGIYFQEFTQQHKLQMY